MSSVEKINTFCPYTGDIFAVKTDDIKLKRIFTKLFKF
jgi:hypothetical protein